MFKQLLAAGAIWLAAVTGVSAQSVTQSGSVTPGHLVVWTTNGVVSDAGTAASPSATRPITSIGVRASGPGICQYSDAQTAAGYQRICLSVTTASGGAITIDSFGTVTPQPFALIVNGVTSNLATVTPPFVTNDLACFQNTSGVIYDCGSSGSSIVNSVSNSDGTLTILPTTGAVVASLNRSHVNAWLANQYFGSGVPWVDVKSGANGCAAAVGDASTDDTAAIQCQINWAFNNLNGQGGTVFFPISNYRVSSPGIVVKGAVALKGSGKGVTGLSAVTDTTVVTFDAATCLTGGGASDISFTGWQNAGATQDNVVVGANCATVIQHSVIWGGHHAINTAGVDGTYWDIYPCGWTGDNIKSTGANWYFDIKGDSCSGPGTANGFEQGATSGLAENFIYRMDLSCGSCTNSVLINDTTGTHAVTHFYGAIASKPIVISNALNTAFFGGEYGSTFSGAGQVSVVGMRGSASVPTGTATYNCAANFNVGCPMIQATIYGGTAANATLTLISTSNGSPSGDFVLIEGSTVTVRNLASGTSVFNLGVANTTAGQFNIAGASTGSQRWLPASVASGTITFPAGTVDFSGTGGTSQVVKQTSLGGIFTVGQLSCSDLTVACLTANQTITLSGDVTGSGSTAITTTLATVASAGTTGSSTAIPVITINAKGLTTSITTAAVIAPAGTLTGNTLAAGVTASSLTSLGTITSLTATTINAFTLGGTISGGGNQLNNIVIGTVSPSTATFTQVVVSTAITDPLLVGGSGTTGTLLTFKTTTGTGTTDAFSWVRGTNGATTAMTLNNTGLSVGAVAPTFRGNISNNTAVLPSNPGSVGADIVLGIASADASSNRLGIFSAGTGALSSVSYFTSRGTLASPTVNQSGDLLGSNFWEGYNGSAYTPGAGFIVTTTELWSGTASGTKLDIYTTRNTTTGVVIAATFQPSGGVSIGTATDPGVGSLQVNAQIFAPNITQTSGAVTGTVCWTTTTGKFTIDTTTTCLLSLEELKNIRAPISGALDLVSKLDPFWFSWKQDTPEWAGDKAEQPGLGAHQVASVDPRLAAYDIEGNLHGVRYQELTAVLVGAVKELKADNDNMRLEIDRLNYMVSKSGR